MISLVEALISNNTRHFASIDDEPSKYILMPHGDFFSKISSNKEYIDKMFNDCPYAYVWIIDKNDLVELEQKFYPLDQLAKIIRNTGVDDGSWPDFFDEIITVDDL